MGSSRREWPAPQFFEAERATVERKDSRRDLRMRVSQQGLVTGAKGHRRVARASLCIAHAFSFHACGAVIPRVCARR